MKKTYIFASIFLALVIIASGVMYSDQHANAFGTILPIGGRITFIQDCPCSWFTGGRVVHVNTNSYGSLAIYVSNFTSEASYGTYIPSVPFLGWVGIPALSCRRYSQWGCRNISYDFHGTFVGTGLPGS